MCSEGNSKCGLGVWGARPPPPRLPASSSAPWGLGGAERGRGWPRACAARVSAPGGEGHGRDPGETRSARSFQASSSQDTGGVPGPEPVPSPGAGRADGWGCRREPEAGNGQIPEGHQPGSDFPKRGALYTPRGAGHSTVTKNQPRGAPFNFLVHLKNLCGC